MNMNSYFGGWYRSAGIRPEGILLEKRWEAIESFEAGAGNILSLTQIFYELSLTDASFAETFRAAFNKADPNNFQMSGNERELIVLAGAKLVDVMQSSARNIADFAALCLVCAGAQNLRATPAVQQIPEIAAKYLGERSVARAKPEEEDDEETEIKKLLMEFPIVSEECNMLWWLISETSRDVDKRWSEMPLGMACTLTAKELADLTQIIPGPIAARAFLDRAVRSGRDKIAASISITEMVNDTDKTWRDSHFSKAISNGFEGILPLTHAVTLSAQSSNSTAWRSMFKATTGIAATAKSSPDTLAYQFYLEQLAARSFNEMKES